MCKKEYEILSGNTLVAVWQGNELQVINDKLLPPYLKRVPDADMWLETRAIDSHRANSRLLKKALKMAERDDLATVIQANGVTITDNYWIRALGSETVYDDVKFDIEYFVKQGAKSAANIALNGNYTSFNYVSTHNVTSSAELTNIGSFEKCWKMIEGRWWMFKAATPNESFSEVFISKFCKLIGISAAVYTKGTGCVKSIDFTEGASVNFEAANTFMGEEEDYEKTIERLNILCPEAVEDYIRMIFLDALIANPDRHTANFGLLRNIEDGNYIGFAPCFDHNMALIARGYPSAKVTDDLLIRLFLDVIREHPEKKVFVPKVTRETIEKAIEETNMRVRKRSVLDYIWKRYEIICDGLNKID